MLRKFISREGELGIFFGRNFRRASLLIQLALFVFYLVHGLMNRFHAPVLLEAAAGVPALAHAAIASDFCKTRMKEKLHKINGFSL